MFAIVSIAGQQFKVEEGQQIFVHRLAANEGDAVSFDTVHLIDNNGNVTIGVPNIKGAQVSASVLGHLKGDKVIVFKKKRRKGYRKKNGHRQSFTKINIDAIKGWFSLFFNHNQTWSGLKTFWITFSFTHSLFE